MDAMEERIGQAALPTAGTIASRTNLLTQTVRFMAINWKMIRIIFKSHS